MRRGFITYLFNDTFHPGVFALADSLRHHSSTFPLLCLCGPDVSGPTLTKLTKLGVETHSFGKDEVISPRSTEFVDRYRADPHLMMTKLLIFRPIGLQHAFYLDADTLVLSNIDWVLEGDIGFAAVPLPKKRGTDRFSAGVMRFSPELATFKFLKDEALTPKKTGGGRGGYTDQTLINEVFRDEITLLPKSLNVSQKDLARSWPTRVIRKSLRLLKMGAAEAAVKKAAINFTFSIICQLGRVKVLHFDGKKPWDTSTSLSELGRPAALWIAHFEQALRRLDAADNNGP